MLKEVLGRYPDDVRVVLRHYPLDTACNPDLKRQLHPTACLAAQAAECAGEQGAFWSYADRLFGNQGVYSFKDLEAYARELGLDGARFRNCLIEGRGREWVRQDLEEARRIDVRVTPTLIINGRKKEGGLSPEQFAWIIALEKGQVKEAAN